MYGMVVGTSVHTFSTSTTVAPLTTETNKSKCVFFSFLTWTQFVYFLPLQTPKNQFDKCVAIFTGAWVRIPVAKVFFSHRSLLPLENSLFRMSNLYKAIIQNVYEEDFSIWAIPGLFLFSSFQSTESKYKICRWLDSLVSEAIALTTEPQPLPIEEDCIGFRSRPNWYYGKILMRDFSFETSSSSSFKFAQLRRHR